MAMLGLAENTKCVEEFAAIMQHLLLKLGSAKVFLSLMANQRSAICPGLVVPLLQGLF